MQNFEGKTKCIVGYMKVADSKGNSNKKDTMEIDNIFSSCLYYFHGFLILDIL